MAVLTTLYFDTMRCGECEVHFALEREHRNQLIRTGDDFYCPNGHCRVFRESENAQLKRQLKVAKNNRDFEMRRADTAERRARAARGQVTKIKNRVTAGVCISCKRNFANLRQHMATKHCK